MADAMLFQESNQPRQPYDMPTEQDEAAFAALYGISSGGARQYLGKFMIRFFSFQPPPVH